MAAAPNRRAPGLLLSWFVLDASMAAYLWLDGPSSLSRILLAGGIALLLYVLIRRPTGPEELGLHQVELAVGALLVVELVARIAVPYRPETPAPSVPVPGLAMVGLPGVSLWIGSRIAMGRGATVGNSENARWIATIGGVALTGVLLAALLARFVIVAWDVEPGFDVHLIQQAAGTALLRGENPYLTHVYHAGYPYWPLSAVLAAAGLVLGDARWGLLVADTVTIVAFVVIARNVNAPGQAGAALAALLLWNASGLYMTWQSLPESLVIAFTALGIALLTRPNTRGIAAGIAFGLAVATKQLALGLLPMLPITRNRRQLSAFAASVAVAGTILASFLVQAPAAFIEGSVASHLVEPARDYAINLLDPLPGVLPPVNVPFVVTAIVALALAMVVRLRWPDGIDGWLAASIALLTTAFALIGISFLNYYQIPLAMILVLVLAPDGWALDRWARVRN